MQVPQYSRHHRIIVPPPMKRYLIHSTCLNFFVTSFLLLYGYDIVVRCPACPFESLEGKLLYWFCRYHDSIINYSPLYNIQSIGLMNVIKGILLFTLGFLTRHLIGVLFDTVSVWVWDADDAEPVPHNLTTRIIKQLNDLYPQEGIYPLLRDFQCGHENMQTPRVLNSKMLSSLDL